MTEPQPVLSLVVPMYNESAVVEAFFARVVPIVSAVTPAWEMIVVDDGSADDTLARVKAHAAAEPRIRFVALSRNFGKEAALTAGLDHASGQAVIPMDADLQDPPELIPEMVRQWQQGYKVVLATRRARLGDSGMKRFTAGAFYKLMRAVVPFPIPENTGDFRLMDAQVVAEVRQLGERTRFMKGLLSWVGFRTTRIYFERQPRVGGAPKQNYRRLWQLAKDGIFSFTTLPLRLMTTMGVVVSFAAFVYGAYIILRTLIYGVDLPGYASLLSVMLFIGGIQLICLGILGEYIGRIYREVKQRPLYVVEERG